MAIDAGTPPTDTRTMPSHPDESIQKKEENCEMNLSLSCLVTLRGD